MEYQKLKHSSLLNIAVIILALLLTFSICSLYITAQAINASGENGETAEILELYQGKPSDNQKFEALNMLPGDSVTQYFCIKAYHNADITLYFNAEVTEETKSLSNVLHIKVTHVESGNVLCDASFSEIDGEAFSLLLTANEQGESIANYQIDVSLDTSVGNEYQAASLKADLNWYVEDDGGLTPPVTGENISLIIWIAVAFISLALILLLILKRRKEARAE